MATSKQLHINPNDVGVLKRKYPVALALSICFGWLGLDRFYLGKTGVGLLKMFTMGLFGILWLVDIIMIATKSVRGISWERRDNKRSWLAQYMAVPIILVVALLIAVPLISRSSDDNTLSTDTHVKQSAKVYRFTDRADKQPTDTEIFVNESATINGMKITPTVVTYNTKLGDYNRAAEGKTYVVIDVQLDNLSSDTQSYGSYDFRVQTAAGQVLDSTYASSVDELESGDLVSSGHTIGRLVFEVPIEDGHQYMIWKPGIKSDRAIIQIK
jgi:hypothetical protein